VRVRLVSIAAVAALALVLVALSLIATHDPALAVVIGVLSLTLSQSLIATLSNYVAAATLTAEGYVHEGAIITSLGPDGPFTGVVTARLPRVTVLLSRDGSATLVQPNAVLTASAVTVLKAWPVTD
jgi:hypothetical protein